MLQITQQINLGEFQQELLNNLKEFEISEYDIDDLIRKIRTNYIRQQIKVYNIFNIEKHNLNNDYGDGYRKLNSLNTLEEIKEYINNYFKEFSKDDRINELMFSLDTTKLLNKDKKNFYHYSDMRKDYTEETFKEELKKKCEKEILFSCYNLQDKYRRQSYLNKLKELLELLFNIKIDVGLYEDDLKTAEDKINNSKDIKIRLFKEWFYISFKDKEKQTLLFNLALKESLERFRNY